VPQDKNKNYVGILHGGAIMAFADAAASNIAHFASDAAAVTVSFNGAFLGAGVADTPIYGTGRVLRETKSMVFVQG
jgi:acyl-coenzyme A thioesterase PaaI-like protein